MLTANIEEELSVSVTKINGLLLRKMIIAGANELNENKQLVDSLNVFPVPDGDTGTNMSLTALAAARETQKSDSLSVGDIAKSASNGALRGARGNSGVITSQLFRGFAKGLEGLQEAGIDELVQAIRKGVQTAYKAVMKPKEGTILTVARACADSAEKAAKETNDVEVFLKTIIDDANLVLLQTTEMLPVLKQAGVVDAGGKGLLCILEGAYKNMNATEEIKVNEPLQTTAPDFSALSSIEHDTITFGYCTEFFIHVKNAEESVVQMLKSYLETIGDSIVCVSDEEIIKIHVHTDHPGLAIERALTIGSLSGLKIDNMREQHTSKIDFGQNTEISQGITTAQESNKERKSVGFIAISAGEGLTKIFKNLGADEVIEGGQTMNPSTEDILNAIERVNADSIFVFPNNKNIILAAEQAAKLTQDKQIFVIPSRSVPEGIHAMFHYEEEIPLKEVMENMINSMKEVKTASVTYAVRDTSLNGKNIKEGDILGMIGEQIAIVSENVQDGTKALIEQILTEDSDVVSLYFGAEVTEDQAEEILQYIEENYPECEAEIQAGNQPLYYYIISVE